MLVVVLFYHHISRPLRGTISNRVQVHDSAWPVTQGYLDATYSQLSVSALVCAHMLYFRLIAKKSVLSLMRGCVFKATTPGFVISRLILSA